MMSYFYIPGNKNSEADSFRNIKVKQHTHFYIPEGICFAVSFRKQHTHLKETAKQIPSGI
jgi:hypothetical protein